MLSLSMYPGLTSSARFSPALFLELVTDEWSENGDAVVGDADDEEEEEDDEDDDDEEEEDDDDDVLSCELLLVEDCAVWGS